MNNSVILASITAVTRTIYTILIKSLLFSGATYFLWNSLLVPDTHLPELSFMTLFTAYFIYWLLVENPQYNQYKMAQDLNTAMSQLVAIKLYTRFLAEKLHNIEKTLGPEKSVETVDTPK